MLIQNSHYLLFFYINNNNKNRNEINTNNYLSTILPACGLTIINHSYCCVGYWFFIKEFGLISYETLAWRIYSNKVEVSQLDTLTTGGLGRNLPPKDDKLYCTFFLIFFVVERARYKLTLRRQRKAAGFRGVRLNAVVIIRPMSNSGLLVADTWLDQR